MSSVECRVSRDGKDSRSLPSLDTRHSTLPSLYRLPPRLPPSRSEELPRSRKLSRSLELAPLSRPLERSDRIESPRLKPLAERRTSAGGANVRELEGDGAANVRGDSMEDDRGAKRGVSLLVAEGVRSNRGTAVGRGVSTVALGAVNVARGVSLLLSEGVRSNRGTAVGRGVSTVALGAVNVAARGVSLDRTLGTGLVRSNVLALGDGAASRLISG